MTGKNSSKIAKESKTKHSENTKYVDLLDEDKPISGQKYACLSFISPEDHIKRRELFYFDKFLKNFEFKKTFEKYTQFLNYIAYKYSLDFNKLSKDMEDFVEEEKDNLFLTTLDDEYKSYIDAKEEQLLKEYNEAHEFQTNTRGIKVRGVFGSQEEAELRCKMLREADPNHDVYVGPVGIWMPFHPEAYKTGRVEYLEKELNELMAQKKENDEVSKENFKKRVKDAKQKAIEENIAKAEKEGNKLMQTINEDGDLVNADTMDVPGKNLLFGDGDNDDVATADLRKQLFEDENVILPTDKDNDHGVSAILENQKKMAENKEDLEKETDIKDPTNVD
tara:strand:- start:3937 stop:4941 length:1005 start_codon:yes stop_codon:yes gene_type:complete